MRGSRNRAPARRKAFREVRRRLLVVCEGERTEPEYIRGFERHVRNATVAVEIRRESGDPRYVVDLAKKLFAYSRLVAKRSGDPNDAFDEVWVVFDRDEHPRYDEAMDMARANGLQAAVSNPCFELWLLLHFRECPGMQHRHDMQRLLAAELGSPGKGVDFAVYASSVALAEERARRMDERAAEDGEPHRNPTTGVYRLTQSIARTG
jgi:hypothetical protein